MRTDTAISAPEKACKEFLTLMEESRGAFRFSDKREMVMLIATNAANIPISAEVISVGDVNCCTMPRKVILAAALSQLASGIILCHTHPSNTVKPSLEDIKQTDLLRRACNDCDMQLLDHIIAASDGSKFYSFAEEKEIEL